MDKKMDVIKILSVFSAGLGFVATLLSNYATSREQEVIIEKKVNEALAARKDVKES